MLVFDLYRSQMASLPLSGTYTLTFNSNTTVSLAHDATSEEVGIHVVW